MRVTVILDWGLLAPVPPSYSSTWPQELEPHFPDEASEKSGGKQGLWVLREGLQQGLGRTDQAPTCQGHLATKPGEGGRGEGGCGGGGF